MECGYFKELLVRWFRFGTFCPIMSLHDLRLPGQDIINKSGEVREWTGADSEIWSYGAENYQIMKKFIEIRESMRDYTRSLMGEAHRKGTLVMRTLFYEFPKDSIVWDIMDEYRYGEDILVAPICHAHKMGRKVYLPAGSNWTDVINGDVYEGGKNIQVEAEIDTPPIFLREGAREYLIHKIQKNNYISHFALYNKN